MACCIVLAMIMANLVGVVAWIRRRVRYLAVACVAASLATAATASMLSQQLTPTHFLADFGLLAFAMPLCGS